MKILCVGKNYAKHALELGGETPSEPIWFWKPESAIIHDGQDIIIPAGIGEVHHEVELAIRIGNQARKVSESEALNCIDAFAIAIDVTARDLQAAAKKAGKPWAQAKGFDTFLPLGTWIDFADQDLQALQLRLTINGEARQAGNTADMTWPVEQLVSLASQWTTLEPGDIILTGTPEGVGPMAPGQNVVAELEGYPPLTVGVSS